MFDYDSLFRLAHCEFIEGKKHSAIYLIHNFAKDCLGVLFSERLKLKGL